MLLQETGKPIELDDLEELASYWLNLSRKSLAPKTIVRRITSVRAFAKWAGLGPILESYVAPVPGRPVPHPIPEGIEGVAAMCDAATQAGHAALVALGGYCGCRVAESLAVRPIDVDIREQLLTIRGKGDRIRYVPISSSAWTNLAPVVTERIGEPDKPLLRYGDRFARQVITDLAQRAGLTRRVASHDLRATFATAVYGRTNDLRLVQELLGHSSPTTTQVYTLIQLQAMRKGVEGL